MGTERGDDETERKGVEGKGKRNKRRKAESGRGWKEKDRENRKKEGKTE